MIEDDQTIEILRERQPKPRKTPRRGFMAASELRLIRANVLKATQRMLGEQLINPDNGLPTHQTKIVRWENGALGIPLWAARRIRELAECAKRFDFKREVR